MKIISLMNNSTRQKDMAVEHGFSLYIEAAGKKILFDMGQTAIFTQNAQALGVDLEAVDIAVLSHGHNDHGGGLLAFLEINHHAKVYLRPEAFLPHFNGKGKDISIDASLHGHPQLVFTTDVHPLSSGLTLFSCNDMPRPHAPGVFGLTQFVNGNLLPDDFNHEQYLLIEEEGRRVLISGCSHKGIVDLTDWFHPDVVIGGFHVSKMPIDHQLTEMAQLLNSYPTDFYTCHCTGDTQLAHLQLYMPRLFEFFGGDTLVL